MIAGSLSSCIAGFRRSCRFSQSSGPRNSCVGTGPAFAATGVGSRAHWVGDRRSTRSYAYWKVEPRYVIRDRDAVYGDVFIRRLRAMRIRDRPTAPRSPWQNGYCERAIGSIRRECLDHVVVFGELHLRHLMRSYATYYNRASEHPSGYVT